MSLLTSLVAYYSLQGNSNDASGNGKTGTDTNITYSTSYGKINQGALFNGSGYITLPNLGAYTAFSVFAWVKATANGSATSSYIFASGGTQSIGLTIGSGGNKLQAIIYPASVTNLVDNSNYDMNDSTFHYVGITWDGTTLTLYRDGSSRGSATQSATNAGGSSTWIGYNGGSPTNWIGDIDEVGLWDRVLTGAEITSLYNGGAGLAYPFSAPANGNFFAFF